MTAARAPGMIRPDAGLVGLLALRQRPWGERGRVAAAAAVIVGMILACTTLVYATGGIKFVFSHAMYLPILLAGALFGPLGGVVAGLLGGVALGPLMPIDTVTGESQQLLNWLYRAGFFATIGAVTGGLVDAVASFAGRDPITGTPSLMPLRHDLGKRIRRHDRGERPAFSLLLVRLTNHADVASTFGPETGTQLLRELVARLEAATSDEARVYHLHGETFGIIADKTQLSGIRGRVREQLRRPTVANGVPVYINLAFGRADCPDHSQVADVLLQQATSALGMMDGVPGAESVYDVRHDQRNRQNLLLLSGLGEAITAQELRLHYQPQIALTDERVTGVEALVRWRHPDQGLLLPRRFVPQAEKTDLIQDLTAWVLRAALLDVSRLRVGIADWRMAVNLSASNLQDGDLLPTIERTLEDSGVAPEHLEVEVTESAVLADAEKASAVLREVRDRGIGVAIDDFGAGNTSLGYLKHLPANRLKIDRCFVQNVASDAADRHIVASVVSLAHKLDMSVVAEGVEDAGTLEMVGALGCDVAQGFLICHPRSAADLEGFTYSAA